MDGNDGRAGNVAARTAAATAALAVLLSLGGCAGYSPASLPVGATTAEIAARMGPATGRLALAGGAQRLEYARGPYGRHTYILDLDAQGRLVEWEQVLVEAKFNAIRTGMAQGEVLAAIGHPSEQRRVGWPAAGTVWAYRYETPFCQWFQLSLDAAGKVTDTGYGPDPMCSHDGDRDAP